MPLPTLRLPPHGSQRTARGETWFGYSFVPGDLHPLPSASSPGAPAPCRSPLPPGRSVPTPHRSPSPRAGGARWHPPSSSPSARNGLHRLRHTGSQLRKNGHRYTYVNPHTEKRIMPFLCCSQGQSVPPSGSYKCSKANSIPHFPECNSAATQDPHLCSSKRPPSPLTRTLSHCDIAVIREETATLRHRQCTDNHEIKANTARREAGPIPRRCRSRDRRSP